VYVCVICYSYNPVWVYLCYYTSPRWSWAKAKLDKGEGEAGAQVLITKISYKCIWVITCLYLKGTIPINASFVAGITNNDFTYQSFLWFSNLLTYQSFLCYPRPIELLYSMINTNDALIKYSFYFYGYFFLGDI